MMERFKQGIIQLHGIFIQYSKFVGKEKLHELYLNLENKLTVAKESNINGRLLCAKLNF